MNIYIYMNTHKNKYYLAIRKDKLLPFATT